MYIYLCADILTMQTRLIQAYTCILLIIWTMFIFWDKQHVVVPVPNSPSVVASTIEHSAAVEKTDIQTTDTLILASWDNTDHLLPQNYAQKQANIDLLVSLYTKTPSIELLNSLIDVLLAQHRFTEAYRYVQESLTNYPGSLDPHTHIYAALHSPDVTISQAWSISSVEKLVEEYRNKNLLNADDYLFYQGIIKFWYGDFDSARLLFKQITWPTYRSIVDYVLNTFDTLSTQKDIPQYYADAIVSLALMKNGYYSVAKKLATSIVLQNKDYILPYQILAYSHFMTQNWDTSIEYFLKLRELESKQEQRYTFLIGVAYYWKWDFSQSIMYLQQVQAGSLTADAYRYIFLSYNKAGEYNKAISTRQKLMWHTDISKDDFYTYFYQTFFAPIRNGSTWDMYTNNPDIARASIGQCRSAISEENQDVCDYGQAWLALANGDMPGAKEYLDVLIQNYDEPYLFHALGDYYAQAGDSQTAEEYYTKVIEKSTDATEQNIIKKKMIDIYDQ